MSDQENTVEPIWVTTAEAAEITGYNRKHVMRLALQMWRQPEAERSIKVRRRSIYELWLPDLMNYIKNIGNGPEPKRAKKK